MPINRTKEKTSVVAPQSMRATDTPRSGSWSNPDTSGRLQNMLGNADDKGATKYAFAVQLAQDKFKDDPDVTDKLFRNSVDEIYNGMREEGDMDAAALRGENPVQQFGRAIGEGIDEFNNMVGTGLDWLVDNVAAPVVQNTYGAFTENPGIGDAIRNVTTADDLAMIPDLLEDIGLTAVPVVGPALAVGKNVAQRTDDIASAIGGRDVVTREQLNDWQRIGRGGEALLSSALSAIPGVGSAVGKGVGKTAQATIETAQKNAFKEAVEALSKKASANPVIQQAGREEAKVAKAAAKTEGATAAENVADDTVEAAGDGLHAQTTASAAEAANAGSEAAEGAAKASNPSELKAQGSEESVSRFRQAAEDLRKVGDAVRAASYPTRIITGPGLAAADMALASMGQTGDNPWQSMIDLFSNGQMPLIMPVGNVGMRRLLGNTSAQRNLSKGLNDNMVAKRIRQVQPKENQSKDGKQKKPRMPWAFLYGVANDVPFDALRAAAAGNAARMTMDQESVPQAEYDYDQLMAIANQMNGGR